MLLRLLTAAVLIPVVVALVWWAPAIILAGIAAVVAILALVEFLNLGDRIGLVNVHPPAQEVKQVHGIATQSGFRKAAHTFAIQETIDPFHFAPHRLLDDSKWTSCVIAILRMDHLEGHACASNRCWNCWASPTP